MGSNIAVMYVWTANKDSWGHASLSLNGAYISSWPTGDKSKNSMKRKKTAGRTKERLPDNYEDDRDNFTGREYTHRFCIRIGAKRAENILKWWENIKEEGGYHFLFNNCCDAVVQALREGGIDIETSFIKTPGDMVGLGKELEKKTTDEGLKDVKYWKEIRYKPLPRLNNLKQELYRANEKIKAARKVRNISIGGSLFVGALLAPLTGWSSLVGAAAMTTGAAGITFIRETYIERNVIETTQAAVDKDKKETIRRRQRVTNFFWVLRALHFQKNCLVNLDTYCDLREQSRFSFIKSWAGTDSTSLSNAIAKLEKYTGNLESELDTVEEVQENYAMV